MNAIAQLWQLTGFSFFLLFPIETAAISGSLDCVKYLHQNGYDTTLVWDNAAGSGDVALLDYVYKSIFYDVFSCAYPSDYDALGYRR